MNGEGVDSMAAATLIAVLVGPVLAVLVTRLIDQRREVRARRMDVFRTLMRTRKLPVHFDHVGALNLVEVEFADKKQVISAWKDYLKSLSERLASNASEEEHEGLRRRRDSGLTKLIYEISKVLNFKVEQLDILEGNYMPQVWDDDDWEQRMVRRSLRAVLDGQRPVLFQHYSPQAGLGPYPPAPKGGEQKSGDASA
ncbi:DUF6680 family protein [Albimonas pacifica]|uniref:DUF6680 family protein n=1 Tax=Albimonas pacifica TaxID=1114924 RepID=UPI0011600F7F|nr:DUF6680 family protein [Albimonas pacifica]